MNEMPAEAQGAWWRSLFRDSPTCSAWPGEAAAPWMVRRWSGQMTEISKAAGRPRSQFGRKMSAGRDWRLGMVEDFRTQYAFFNGSEIYCIARTAVAY